MKNLIQKGEILSLAAPYDRASGQGAKIGSLFGVAAHDVLNGVVGEFQINGVFSIAKNSAEAWTVGAKIYWDDTAKVCTTTSTSNLLVGHAVEAAANPSSTGKVRLHGTPG